MILSKKHRDAIMNGHHMGDAKIYERQTETQSLRLYSGVIVQMPKRANKHHPVVDALNASQKKSSLQ